MIKLARFRQEFSRQVIEDITAAVNNELNTTLSGIKLKPGARVAITAGSRGIRNMVEIYKAAVHYLKKTGAEPFLFAAMGSHGGGTVDGQQKILKELGVTEETIGALILVTSDTKEVGTTTRGMKVYCDAIAASADAILIINRIKPHTSFRGNIESGLWKMMAVGMGKVPGATLVHRLGPGEIAQNIIEIGEVCLKELPVIGGLAVVENSYDETSIIKGIKPENMLDEKELLVKAKDYLPGLPVDDIDVLIVDEMGKNFSGTGMDVNVIGRWKLRELPEPERPKIKRLVVLDITKESKGNANGIGLADLTTKKLVSKIDFEATYLNCFTTTFFSRAMIPVTLDTDKEAINCAFKSIGKDDYDLARVIRIPNTLHLDYIYASPGLHEELLQIGLVQDGEYKEILFDEKGNLI